MDNQKGKCCNCPGFMGYSQWTIRTSTRNIIPFKVMESNKITNHNELRQLLIDNAEVTMAKSRLYAEKNFKCNFKPKAPKVPKAKKAPKVSKASKKVNKLKPKVSKKK